MSAESILTIVAVVLSPVIAIQVSSYLERKRLKRKGRMFLFKTLMATRASRLSVQHVNALNSIDVEFYGKDKKSEAVVDAWKIYLDHLGNKNLLKASEPNWADKQIDLLVDLLAKMADNLDMDFDRYSIKNTSYIPEFYGQLEDDQLIIRKFFVSLIQGNTAFPILVKSDYSDEDQTKLKESYAGIITGEKALKVEIIDK